MAKRIKVTIFGHLKAVEFHKVKGAAEQIRLKDSQIFEEPFAIGLLECDWVTFQKAKKKELKGEMWGFNENVMTFVDNQLIGGHEEFLRWAEENYQYKDFRPLPLWHAMMKESYKNYLIDKKHDFVYMDIAIGNETVGKLLIELFTSRVPRTCNNFKQLCRGNSVESVRHDPPLKLCYKGSLLHRVVPNGWIQGGDFEGGRGDGGESIYGTVFDDEDFSIPHNKRGILGMANKGRHTNASQFYLTLQPAPWMDTKYVAFGQVIEGADVLDKLEATETYNERPKLDCKIADCGTWDTNSIWNRK